MIAVPGALTRPRLFLYKCNVRAVDQRGDPNALFLEAMSVRCLELSHIRKLHANTASPSLFKI